MDFLFLPDKVKTQIPAECSQATPLALLRSSCDIEGAPGEGYAIAYADRLFVFWRKGGSDSYGKIEMPYSCGALSLKKESFNVSLVGETGEGERFTLKFSSFDEAELAKIIAAGKTAPQATEAPPMSTPTPMPMPTPPPGDDDIPRSAAPPPLPDGDLNTIELLAATLMFIAKADGAVHPHEDAYIRRVCLDDKTALSRAHAFFKANDWTELLKKTSSCVFGDLALCFTANALEVGMMDNSISSKEQAMARELAFCSGVTQDEYDTVLNVLVLKNRLPSPNAS